MVQEIVFDPRRDIEETIPNLAMNVTEAMITGVVKDTIDTTPYSKETDVFAIGNYITDNIDVAMNLKKLGKSLSQLPTKTTPSTSNGEGA